MGFSIATKIFLAFTALLMTFGSVLTFNVYQMRAIYEEVALINGGFVPLSLVLSDIKSDLRTYTVLLGERDWEALRRTLSAIRAHYDFPEQIDIKLKRAEEHVAHILESPLSNRDKLFLQGLQAELRETRSLNASFTRRSERFTEAVLAGRVEEGEALQVELRRMSRRFESRLRASQQAVREEIDTSLLRAQRGEKRSLGGAVILSLIALMLSVVIMLVIHFTIRPLRHLTEGVKRIAGGEYRRVAPVRSRDEIGVLASEFNAMVDKLADRDATLREQAGKLEQAYEDLTRVNARLVVLRDFTEDILNSVNMAIVAVDKDARVTSANRSAERLFGVSGGSIVGSSAARLPPLRAIEAGEAQLREVMTHGRVHQHEAVSVTLGGGGEGGLFDLLLLPLKARDGESLETAGALVVCDNVTERVKTKEALIKSERLAAVGEIAAKVTHELRNPLSTIRLNTEILADELIDQGVREDSEPQATLRNIVSEVERLTALTEDYLRFARLPEPNPTPGDLNALVEETLEFQRDELEWGGVEIVMTLEEDLPQVLLDEAQLRRALLNLVRNAREAMESREPRRLEVSTRLIPGAEGPSICLKIADTGCGIPTDEVERIFEPFFSTKAQGTGLGLPLTLQIIEEHGGTITCHSQVGVGTIFEVILKPEASPSAPNGGSPLRFSPI